MSFFRKKPIYKEDKFEIVFTDVSSLKNVKNWEKNRPVDQIRVEQIKEHFINNEIQLVPGILYIWKISDNEMYIYDGLHRFLAASESNKSMKCIVKFFFGKLPEVIADFENVNLSVSLPFLYLEENNHLKRKVCEKIVQRLCDKFPEFVSPSRRPQKQNFNRE